MTEPTEFLIKEVYARFGLAYYESECLHRGLCILYVLSTFRSKQDVTGPRFEENLGSAFSKTLGTILVTARAHLPKSLYEKVKDALEKRNYLAHHFWFERCHLMFSNEGLYSMLKELSECADLFELIDKELEPIVTEKLLEFGVTPDIIQEAYRDIQKGKPWEPLPKKRVPISSERIVCIWDAPYENGTTLIFQSEDGCLWQLCDVGLGWTRYDSPLPHWKVSERLQRYLPVSINSRPKTGSPWNFEFKLRKGVELWVKKGNKDKTFRWGIRITQ